MWKSYSKTCKGKAISKPRNLPINEGNELKKEVGACGIYCGFCKTFRLGHDRCLGCDWGNKRLRKVRESRKGCVFWECIQEKKVECCLMCEEFPCKIHYDSKEAVYTRQALDMWKELGKTGLTQDLWKELVKKGA